MTATEIETLLRTLAPLDFPPDSALYVAMQSDGLPAEFNTGRSMGYTATTLDGSLRSWLSSQSRWHGRGAAIVLDDEEIAAWSGHDADGDLDCAVELFQSRLPAIAVHEFAHVLERPVDLRVIDEQQGAQLEQLLVAACATAPAGDLVPWNQHDARWLRLVLHLAYRARTKLDVHIPLPIAVSRDYQLGPVFRYAGALESECEAMADSSFAEIRDRAPPTEFVREWQQHITKWFRNYRDVEREVDAALALFT